MLYNLLHSKSRSKAASATVEAGRILSDIRSTTLSSCLLLPISEALRDVLGPPTAGLTKEHRRVSSSGGVESSTLSSDSSKACTPSTSASMTCGKSESRVCCTRFDVAGATPMVLVMKARRSAIAQCITRPKACITCSNLSERLKALRCFHVLDCPAEKTANGWSGDSPGS